jgi:predicted transcriptional regulator
MAPPRRAPLADLSRRERQIMDVVYALGSATAVEVHARIPEPPTLTAVRTLLRILEDKGRLRHQKEGQRHVYLPTTPRGTAQRSAIRELLRTFFSGDTTTAVATLLDVSERELTGAEREELVRLIRAKSARGE